MRRLSDAVTLRSASASDAEKIPWLKEVSMKTYAEALWVAWHPSDTTATLDFSTLEMIDRNGEAIGYIATRQAPDALHLSRLNLAPAARKQGVGSLVLQEVVGRVETLPCPVRLRVLTNNPALRFYTRQGFRTERETREHIYMIQD